MGNNERRDGLSARPCAASFTAPLLFHPSTRGCHICLDPEERTATRQASFCNAITFSHRPVALCEQVRLKKHAVRGSCWSGAARLGFSAKDPCLLDPCSLPRYSCPDLVAQSGFWAKALPEELADEGNIVAFWVDGKGRVFCCVNDAAIALFFSGVDTAKPLWALVDVYGLTRAVQLLGESSRMTHWRAGLGWSCMAGVSLCALCLPTDPTLAPDYPPARCSQPGAPPQPAFTTVCPVSQNCFNLEQSRLLPAQLHSDLQLQALCGTRPRPQDGRTLAFTSRPLRAQETIFITVAKLSPAYCSMLTCGVTCCDPRSLQPSDLPHFPESLVDRNEFWAMRSVPIPLHSSDILHLLVDPAGRLLVSHNGVDVGGSVEVYTDPSRPLWMFFFLHGPLSQLQILGESCAELSRLKLFISTFSVDTSRSFPIILPKLVPSCPASSREECTICCENLVDTVIYTCGHMCLCYPCGIKLKSMSRACCPICRRSIRDIIKTYSCL
uniref:Neuralized E3 ubiquitin protein ligase 1 n=1 Tax=Scleropages formosus TaxID=113540 RepID=A0A8C9RX25_SCLFO